MRRIELQDLLPASVVSHQTRSEVLQQAARASAGPVTSAVVSGGSSEALHEAARASAGATPFAGVSGGTNDVLHAAARASAGPASSVVAGDGTGGGASTADTLSGLLQEPVKDVTAQISALTAQISSLNATQQTQIGATQDNTQAVSQNTTTKGSSGSSFASSAGSLASSLFGGGLSPIISGLMSLFGGGGSKTTTIATPFRLSAPVQYEAGLTASDGGSSVQPVDHGQAGQVRATPAASPAPQVTIQVNAMDSRSFLDHSEEIAQAVKAAILSSTSLNDVIADL